MNVHQIVPMKTPKFSIIIPTLNEELYLPRLLDSIAQQSFDDIEVIVVDGQSTDGTKVVVERFAREMKARFPVIFISFSVRGVCYQRNRGAHQARGEFLAFFDADAKLPDGYLSAIYRTISEKNARFVTSWLATDSKDREDRSIALFVNLTMEAAHRTHIGYILGFNVIVDRHVFNEVGGFDEKVVHAEDIHFAQQMLSHGYKLTIMRKPRIIFSLRRFKHEGTLAAFRNYAKAAVHVLFKGPITKELFAYPMGGHVYQNDGGKSSEKKTSRVNMWSAKLRDKLREIETLLNNEKD